MNFEIIGTIKNIQTVAVGGRIHDILRLQKQFGIARWRKMKGNALVRLMNGQIRKAEVHWYEAHGIGRQKFKIRKIPFLIMATSPRKTTFAICIRNQDCDDLEKGMVYVIKSDSAARKNGYLRVVDLSGEDYLYPETYFVELDLPAAARAALLPAK